MGKTDGTIKFLSGTEKNISISPFALKIESTLMCLWSLDLQADTVFFFFNHEIQPGLVKRIICLVSKSWARVPISLLSISHVTLFRQVTLSPLSQGFPTCTNGVSYPSCLLWFGYHMTISNKVLSRQNWDIKGRHSICSNRDGPRDYHTKWSQTEKNKYMISLICGI